VDTINVFVSYNHEQDARWFEQERFGEEPLIPWLESMLKPQGVVFWYDRARLGAGDAFRREIEEQIDRSQVAVLLVSRGFIVSQFIREVELPRIEARVRAGKMTVIPIITRKCPWQQIDFLTSVLVLPNETRPLIEYISDEAEFLTIKDEILEGIERQVDKCRARVHAPPPDADTALAPHAPETVEPEPADAEPAPEPAPPPGPPPQPPRPKPTPIPGPRPDTPAWEREGTNVGEQITGPDGGTYVWVPPGEFVMGRDPASPRPALGRALLQTVGMEPEPASSDESPAHLVHITRGFWLAQSPVTNRQYGEFCAATGATFPENSNQGDDHPVVEVTWEDAQAFCKHCGLRLPTEAEWEYAAGGPSGQRYPWGDKWDPQKCCNLGNKGPGGRTFPVGSFPAGASWCGALDMAGNVWEWCADWYGEGYYTVSPADDPSGPESGAARVLRGGSWSDYIVDRFRCAYRPHLPTCRYLIYGFRSARTA